MRDQIIDALKRHAEGHIAKHKQNVEVFMQKPVECRRASRSFRNN